MTSRARAERIRIGARFPNAGASSSRPRLSAAARKLESAGFDSLWTSDHLAMPVQTRSTYPFSSDGRFAWPLDLGWSDAIVSLGIAAAVTDRIELGTAVLVAPLRNPLVTAMQIASVSLEARGRCALGVGAGWLAEEFDAVGIPFSERGARLDAWIDVVRQVWSGTVEVREPGQLYPNPTEMISRPRPSSPVPILVGGLSPAALRRAGRHGDGWVALSSVDDLDHASFEEPISSIHEHARAADRDESAMRVILQITGSAGRAEEIAGRLGRLTRAGVNEVIVDVSWNDDNDPKKVVEVLRNAPEGSDS